MQNKTWLPLAHMNIQAFAKSFLVPFSFTLPILMLYILDPNSFQLTWKGRFLYLFFIWLFFLEIALVGGKLPKNKLSLKKAPFSLKRKKIRDTIPKRLKVLARSNKMSFLLQRKKIHAVIVAAETFFVNVFRMVPILVAIVAIAAMAVPTVYVIGTYVFGLRHEVIGLGSLLGLPPFGYQESFLTEHWPLSFEYLLFTAFFVASVLLTYGIEGLKRFSVSLFFLGAMGSSYMIDTFYPYGTLIVLQSLVPFSASSAAGVLNWMGYETQLFSYGYTRYVNNRAIEEFVSIIWIGGEKPQAVFAINWPCAGVQSLFIYTFVILLFLKSVSFSLPREKVQAAVPKRLNSMEGNRSLSFLLQRKKIHAAVVAAETFFVDVLRRVPIFTVIVVGAVGTFVVNVLRIVTIFIIGVYAGSEAALMFHSYYGELYFIAWVMLYLFVIVFGPKILARLVKMRRNRL